MRLGWTMGAIGGGMAILTLLLLSFIYLYSYRRLSGARLGIGAWTDALGFGILPALAVGKIYEQFTGEGRGIPVMEPLGDIPWITEMGIFQPCRVECLLLMACFLGMCLWLMFRRQAPAARGDLALICLVLWSGIRTFTEALRNQTRLMLPGWSLIQIAATLIPFAALLLWTLRCRHKHLKTSPLLIDWLVAVTMPGILWTSLLGILSVGSELGKNLVLLGCGALRAAAVLEAGGESRRLQPQPSDLFGQS